MDLRDALRAMRRYWWLVAAAVVVALTGAGLATGLTVPRYATTGQCWWSGRARRTRRWSGRPSRISGQSTRLLGCVLNMHTAAKSDEGYVRYDNRGRAYERRSRPVPAAVHAPAAGLAEEGAMS